MNEKARELQARTQKFATAVIKLCDTLPNHPAVRTIVDQLLASATATDSNYRATCRAKSPSDFISKIATAAEESDESKGWLEQLVASNFTTADAAGPLIQEADELTAIFVKSRITAQQNKQERERVQRLNNKRRP